MRYSIITYIGQRLVFLKKRRERRPCTFATLRFNDPSLSIRAGLRSIPRPQEPAARDAVHSHPSMTVFLHSNPKMIRNSVCNP